MDQSREPRKGFNILFVCTGNTCRSPMAEAIARRALAERGWTDVHVRSAGIAAYEGAPPSEGAIHAGARGGLDLSGHQSSFLSPEVAEWADLILTMSPAHVMRLVELGAGDRTAVLTAYASGVDGPELPESVTDPFGGSDAEYVQTYELLVHLVTRALRRIEPVVTS